MIGYSVFEFDMLTPLVNALSLHFERMSSLSLTAQNVPHVDEVSGVYLLLHQGYVVYVGKSNDDLRKRLLSHSYRIQHRKNLHPQDVTFKAAHVPTLTPMDVETHLIDRYKSAWNNSGFGNNDPGRERDSTQHSPRSFDVRFPIDIDRPDNYVAPGTISVRDLIKQLSDKLPYTLRCTRKPSDLEIFSTRYVTVVTKKASARDLLIAAFAQLPPGYQAWQLPGRIIIYYETKQYKAGSQIVMS